MRVIAIEEHFITPMYRERVGANEFRNFYLQSRGAQLGHDIVEQNSDLGAKRVAHMDAAGIDMQVLSFGSPGTEGRMRKSPAGAPAFTSISACVRLSATKHG